MRAVREAIGPKAELLVDANSGYSVHTRDQGRADAGALRRLPLRGAHPLHRPARHGPDRRAPWTSRWPSGSSTTPATTSRTCWCTSAADIVQPDVTKCGGLSEGKKIAALADAFGKYVTTHTTSVGIGLAAAPPLLGQHARLPLRPGVQRRRQPAADALAEDAPGASGRATCGCPRRPRAWGSSWTRTWCSAQRTSKNTNRKCERDPCGPAGRPRSPRIRGHRRRGP